MRGAIGLGLAGAIAVAGAASVAPLAKPAAEAAQGGARVAAATPPCEIERVERIVGSSTPASAGQADAPTWFR